MCWTPASACSAICSAHCSGVPRIELSAVDSLHSGRSKYSWMYCARAAVGRLERVVDAERQLGHVAQLLGVAAGLLGEARGSSARPC